jgi:LPS sulfotransferase NodH
MQPRYQDKPLPDILSELFPNLRYVRITRRDKPRQAISFWKAYQTGAWGRSAGKETVSAQPPAFDYDAIAKIVRMLQEHEMGIDAFFAQARVQPLTIVYEEFVEAYRETVKSVLQHLGVGARQDLAIAEPRTARQADAETEAWVDLYHRVTEERS